MAPIKPKSGDTQSSRQRTIDEDAIALELAQEELKLVHQSVEELLNVMRNGNRQQLEAIFAAARKGVPQDEILAMVRQYNRDKERADSKQTTYSYASQSTDSHFRSLSYTPDVSLPSASRLGQ